ncbi:MAG: flagellar hook-length control protein FliK [Clostridia bacterium]|nr:flagellar hook-length control protein FliK [Clostridia bacterium]MDD4145750.1 flagellar hook-length control protein FliK [Clostridia bacterium]
MVGKIGSNAANIMVVAKDFAGLILRPGQVFTAVVVSLAQEGEQYLLKTGESLLPVRSEKPLEIGQKIRLHVLGFKGEDLLVEKLPWIIGEEGSKKAKVIARAIAKYGFKGEKETAVIKEALLKLPVEENTAVRYLLDPYLFAALLLPREKREDGYNKLEITRYKGAVVKEDVWEVVFQLQMPTLRKIEVKIKMQGGKLYTQIWADSGETEKILQGKKKDLEKFCLSVEILSFEEGPLIIDHYTENINLMV